MTRTELIDRLAAHYPKLLPKDVQVVVKTILDAMSNRLVKGQRVEIRGFGSFDLHHRPARTGRNPRTGVKVQITGKVVPHITAGRNLRERVDTRPR